jgi:hypothetical protein
MSCKKDDKKSTIPPVSETKEFKIITAGGQEWSLRTHTSTFYMTYHGYPAKGEFIVGETLEELLNKISEETESPVIWEQTPNKETQ